MMFESRSLYAHGQNQGVYLIQIPKMICNDMQLTKDTKVNIEYNDNKIIIEKVNNA